MPGPFFSPVLLRAVRSCSPRHAFDEHANNCELPGSTVFPKKKRAVFEPLA